MDLQARERGAEGEGVGGVHLARMGVGSLGVGEVRVWECFELCLLHTSKNMGRAVGLLARYGVFNFWLAVRGYEYFYTFYPATTKTV